jgi:hypothetical protein
MSVRGHPWLGLHMGRRLWPGPSIACWHGGRHPRDCRSSSWKKHRTNYQQYIYLLPLLLLLFIFLVASLNLLSVPTFLSPEVLYLLVEPSYLLANLLGLLTMPPYCSCLDGFAGNPYLSRWVPRSAALWNSLSSFKFTSSYLFIDIHFSYYCMTLADINECQSPELQISIQQWGITVLVYLAHTA